MTYNILPPCCGDEPLTRQQPSRAKRRRVLFENSDMTPFLASLGDSLFRLHLPSQPVRFTKFKDLPSEELVPAMKALSAFVMKQDLEKLPEKRLADLSMAAINPSEIPPSPVQYMDIREVRKTRESYQSATLSSVTAQLILPSDVDPMSVDAEVGDDAVTAFEMMVSEPAQVHRAETKSTCDSAESASKSPLDRHAPHKASVYVGQARRAAIRRPSSKDKEPDDPGYVSVRTVRSSSDSQPPSALPHEWAKYRSASFSPTLIHEPSPPPPQLTMRPAMPTPLEIEAAALESNLLSESAAEKPLIKPPVPQKPKRLRGTVACAALPTMAGNHASTLPLDQEQTGNAAGRAGGKDGRAASVIGSHVFLPCKNRTQSCDGYGSSEKESFDRRFNHYDNARSLVSLRTSMSETALHLDNCSKLIDSTHRAFPDHYPPLEGSTANDDDFDDTYAVMSGAVESVLRPSRSPSTLLTSLAVTDSTSAPLQEENPMEEEDLYSLYGTQTLAAVAALVQEDDYIEMASARQLLSKTGPQTAERAPIQGEVPSGRLDDVECVYEAPVSQSKSLDDVECVYEAPVSQSKSLDDVESVYETAPVPEPPALDVNSAVYELAHRLPSPVSGHSSEPPALDVDSAVYELTHRLPSSVNVHSSVDSFESDHDGVPPPLPDRAPTPGGSLNDATSEPERTKKKKRKGIKDIGTLSKGRGHRSSEIAKLMTKVAGQWSWAWHAPLPGLYDNKRGVFILNQRRGACC